MRQHPGIILANTIVRPKYKNVTEFARAMKMHRPNISRLVHGESELTVNVARKLEQLGHGTAREWLTLQLDYNLEQARRGR